MSISAALRRGGDTKDGFFSPSIRMVWINAKLSPGEKPSTELAKVRELGCPSATELLQDLPRPALTDRQWWHT